MATLISTTVNGSVTATSSVSGADVYTTSGWFRNHTNNNGIYWSGTGWHLMPHNGTHFRMHSGDSAAVGLRMECNGTLTGYVYSDNAYNIGFLSQLGAWKFRVSLGGDSYLGGNSYIGRHLDAQNNWGNCSCITLFLGWNGSKVVLGNNGNSGHDYANNLGANTVVSTNAFYCHQDITAFSDARVKDNVEVIENAVEKVKAIRGVTFTRSDTDNTEKRHAGVIAQEVLKVLPEVVSEDTKGYYSVAYGNLTSLLIEAIKEQQKQIDELKEQLKNK